MTPSILIYATIPLMINAIILLTYKYYFIINGITKPLRTYPSLIIHHLNSTPWVGDLLTYPNDGIASSFEIVVIPPEKTNHLQDRYSAPSASTTTAPSAGD